jgi:hypothetical protein
MRFMLAGPERKIGGGSSASLGTVDAYGERTDWYYCKSFLLTKVIQYLFLHIRPNACLSMSVFNDTDTAFSGETE